MNFPDNIKYTKDHEWISVQGKIGTIGVTDYAQGELGDVVFIDIDSNKTDIKLGDSVGTIEAVKTVSDIYSPCSGKIVEINKELQTRPELVNTDPYNSGWIVKIEMSDPAELDSLLDSKAYKSLIGK
ncbi:MAG: glycine cleavage system protein GcvH [Ignavibacteriaceae bacterium]|nr:glycine cleavage system protein GcvH [Ignavibacteriaceae bacterium]